MKNHKVTALIIAAGLFLTAKTYVPILAMAPSSTPAAQTSTAIN